jgi:transcriptional regulator with XRE-family HTH domain
MASLGQDLKRERELRGISLREIADSTRISLKFLQALEDDRIENMPGGFFIRAILRSYAKSIGLDEHQVLNKYEQMRLFDEQLQYQEARRAARPAGPPGRRKILLLLIAGIAVIVAAALLFWLVLSPQRGLPAAKPPLQTAPNSVSLSPAPSARQLLIEPPVEEVRSLALDFSFNEDTWLQVYADGNPAWDGVKRPGESLQVNAERELVINCGNAGGTALVLNGKKARPLGPPGTVRKDIRISLENWREYLLPERED